MTRLTMVALTVMASLMALAAPEVPKAAEKALGTSYAKTSTGGKLSIRTGMVFLNGHYLKPSYRVERRGNGLFVNGRQIPGKTVDWQEFIKTQAGAKRNETVIEPVAPAPEAASEPAPEPEAPAVEESDDDISLDDLFEDNPKPKKKAAKKAAAVKKTPPAPRKPTVVVTYEFEGEFQPNEATDKLVAGLDKDRRKIENLLNAGRFVFFGDRYSQVSGDAEALIKQLPGLLKSSSSGADLFAKVRAAGIYFLSEMICADLYEHQADYIQMQQQYREWQKDRENDKLLNGGGL